MEEFGSGGRTTSGGQVGMTGGQRSGGQVGTGGSVSGGTPVDGSAGDTIVTAGGSTGTSSASTSSSALDSLGTGGKTSHPETTNTPGSCPIVTNPTMAVHTIIDVTWPATLGTSGGSGKFHIWTINKFSLDGNMIKGKTIPCGSTVPPLTLTSIVGGGKVLVDIPMSFWDLKPPLEFVMSGKLSGWALGGTITLTGDPALVGLTMTDPNSSWPASYTSITPVDVDKDGKSGLSAIPMNGSGYANPPLSIFGALGPRADRVDVVNRSVIDISGTFTSCTEHSGQAIAKNLDNHIVGCHVAGGNECSPSQVKFLDDNRTVYVIKSGTYVSKVVPDNVTCADVRAALTN